jgi:beta-lactam-binding protein with PASTA domain
MAATYPYLRGLSPEDWPDPPVIDHTGWTAISDLTGLQAMSANLAGNYYLTANIDASATVGWNAGAGFVPVGTGTGTGRFTGQFDGNGYTITGLVCNRTADVAASDYQGLFGSTNAATITSLRMADVAIAGRSFVGAGAGRTNASTMSFNAATGGAVTGTTNFTGGLCGYNNNASTISNCYATGAVTGATYTGGLVGMSQATSTIQNCYATGAVSGTDYTGGLVGLNQSTSTISNCYATGAVSGTDYTAGLCGYNATTSTIQNCYATGAVTGGTTFTGGLVGVNLSTSTISNCYATGTVSGTSYTGGLCGYNLSTSTIQNCFATGAVTGGTNYTGGFCGRNNASTIRRCYSVGAVSASAGSIGGLIGTNDGTAPVVEYSYYDSQTSGQSDTGRGVPKTTAQMKRQSTFETWDFATVWRGGYFNVAFDSDGGSAPDPATIEVYEGGVYGTLPTVTYSPYIFNDWRLSGTVITAASTVTAQTAHTLIAAWAVYAPLIIWNETQAVAAIEALGLTADITRSYFPLPAGQVYFQLPDGGDLVDKDGTVEIIVSLGMIDVLVPDVVGKTETDAKLIIRNAELIPSVSKAYSATVEAGLVISQTPDAGVTVAGGSVVAIVVSLGAEEFAVPDLTGLREADAETQLAALGLLMASTTAHSSTIEAGRVISQDPAPGTLLPPGATVAVVVSLGTALIEVPDVIGETQSSAQDQMAFAGLLASVTFAYSETVDFGKVSAQSPLAGTLVEGGTVVTITVIRGTSVLADLQGELATLIQAQTGITCWRNRLPVGFTNSAKTAFITVASDQHHTSGAMRQAVIEIRVFGGSGELASLRAAMEKIVQTLVALRTSTISKVGEINAQELPPEPDTGWVSGLIRCAATVKER